MIERKLFRQAPMGSPKVIAVFSFRHDAHLVPDFLANIRPFVHGYVAWDDRAATKELTSEPERRNRLLAEARKMGASWILAADPDERIEASLALRLPEMLAMGEGILWSFTIQEMFTPDSYRIDGVWGSKARVSLFPMRAVRRDLDKAWHGSWVADDRGFRVQSAQTNIYHLRMATPERRRLRRELYAAADPDRLFQRIGYDYLDDERGMVLERIPPDREFKPAFTEDHGLWSPDPLQLGQDILPDPPEARLALISETMRVAGHAQASQVLQDLAKADPVDSDFLPMAALLSHMARDLPRTRDLASAVLRQSPTSALALYLRGKASATLGDPACQTDLAQLLDLSGPCLLAQDLAADIARPTADFTRPDALWRHWVAGPATCHEGPRIAAAPISVIVLGFGGPDQLAAAVASLRAQDPPCEIVVVNSGGGPVEQVLADHLDHIRLISTDQPLFVGAARNIGIDASRGRIIAFLAGDCQALPGWVAGRLRRHDLGAEFVSNPVVPEAGASFRKTVTIAAMYSSRSPTTKLEHVAHFGRSCTRESLSLGGYFPTGLRVSEDSALNRQLDRVAPCVWAPDVLTTHAEPPGYWRLLLDSYRRGVRMAAHSPFRQRPGQMELQGRHWHRLCDWHGLTRKTFEPVEQFNQRTTTRRLAIVVPMVAAKFIGLLRGLWRQSRADRILKQTQSELGTGIDFSREGRIVAALRKAFALDPHDPAKAMALGRALDRLGQDGSDAFRKALALDPTWPEPVRHLVAPLLARSDFGGALAQVEAAARQAPLVPGFWMLAAELAEKAGQPALALAYAQRGLCLGLDHPEWHEGVARLHLALGQDAAARCRDDMAMRLRAHRARHLTNAS